jgi:hypothetical protein
MYENKKALLIYLEGLLCVLEGIRTPIIRTGI